MNRLRSGTQDNLILERKFIRMKLSETSKRIEQEQDKRMSGFSSAFWKNRSFAVTDNEMEFTHLKAHRYVDMKRRKKNDGSSINKKAYPIHNRVVMGQYAQLTKELSFGFTEEVKNQLRGLQNF